MDRQDFMGLYESYLGVYEQDEYLDEDVEEIDEEKRDTNPDKIMKQFRRHGAKAGSNNSATLRAAGRFARMAKFIKKDSKDPEKAKEYERASRNESYDLYDLVLEYLLDEGLCESVENAEVMMAHMSEEWVDAIVEKMSEELINENSDRLEYLRKKIGPKLRYSQPDFYGYALSSRRGAKRQPTNLGGRPDRLAKKRPEGIITKLITSPDQDRGSGNAARRRASGR